ncbi:MAG: 2-oxoacid:acceptor oxidoreductase family protein [Rhodopseudomonas palustris]|nr:2-oxoacid:acceptor oxidoreductase family protein [Rhodopseudomonas palustris]
MRSKSAPKYGSEKSGAPTNCYITLSPEPVKITNADLEDVEIVISPDHKVFVHANPLRGLVAGGTFILQSNLSPLEVWRDLPAKARQTIRDKKIKFYVIDAFAVAKRHAPTAELETRMMGIAFIGAVCGHVDRVVADAVARRDAHQDPSADLQEVRLEGWRHRRRQHGGDPRGFGSDPAGQLRRAGIRRSRSPGRAEGQARRVDLGLDVPRRRSGPGLRHLRSAVL